ncbi:3-keto-5-aminohexanoate cleavage protein [Roseicitreum antarcticum]|uniref:Uncharacterized conserved protein, DUF849 family n=1 Tax=Roseicitreum antarcticum TaxID=564137 RepID=A0A1H3B3J4_9RHOB|nr:3-keto-5-aminohexanoate cleavage protein [Roseicitreum antarcticum]SDX35974.1 Uncharacterized conserved protein, DUF849 family [Roseicitreum antarcticum]
MVFLQVALNGDRHHVAAPRSPEAIGRDALAVAEAGAHSVHVHAYDDTRRETLGAVACAAALRAIRAHSPGTPVSLTTSADIVADPTARMKAVQGWTDLPDFVTANQGEDGITELCEYLLSRGVGIEAGLLSPDDARRFVKSPLRDQFHRIMIEPLSPEPEIALRDAAAMEAILTDADITIPQAHHGYDGSCWAVNERALMRGHGMRTGLEDAILLPDGRPANSNGEMAEAAKQLIADVASRR